jgi:cell division protein FtsB
MFDHVTLDFSINLPLILTLLVAIWNGGSFAGRLMEKLADIESLVKSIEHLSERVTHIEAKIE